MAITKKRGKKTTTRGLGWIPDTPNIDDLTIMDVADSLPSSLLNSIDHMRVRPGTQVLPKTVDNRQWNSPVEDQGGIGSCTAVASTSMIEYMENRAFGKHIEASKLFTYWDTRKRMGEQYVGVDSGAYNRTTMKSIVKTGLIDESLWPYDPATYNNKPSIEMYMNKQPYGALSYLRVDTGYGTNYVNRMKAFIASGYALFTGFVVYDNIWELNKEKTVLDYPIKDKHKEIGGHAVMVCGYSDDVNYNLGQGAFLIKNSWGPNWADSGCFWLPYRYFENGLAIDTWCVNQLQYVESRQFD